MVEIKQILVGKLESKSSLSGKLNNAIEKVYPELEDIVVTPMAEEQNLTPSAYGFRNITVKPGSDSSNATATAEDVADGKTVHINNQEVVGTYVNTYNAIVQVHPNSKTTFSMKSGIKKIGTIETTGVTNMSNAFEGCTQLEEVSFTDTSSVTDMYKTFYQCFVLEIPIMNLSKLYNAGYMFYTCNHLKEILLENLRELQYANYMFCSCSNLTKVILKDTDKLRVTDYMFQSCSKLTEVSISNTSNITTMSYMFAHCGSLTNVSQIDTSKATNMEYMFYGCGNLTDVSELNGESCTKNRMMFNNCTKLVNFGGIKNIGKAFTQKTTGYSYYTQTYSSCTQLTYESLLNILNGLYDLNLSYDVANGGVLYRQKIVIGSTNKAKLEATEEGLQALAQADAYGWDVS